MQTNSGHYGLPEVISSQFMVANSTTNTTTGGGRRREESLPSSSSIFPHHLLGHNHVSSLSSNPLLQASIHRYIQQQATSPHFQEQILQTSSQVLSRNEEQEQYDEFQAASVGLLGQRQKLSGMQLDSPQEVLTARPTISSLNTSLLVISNSNSNSNDNKKKDSIVAVVGGNNKKNEDDSKVVLGKVGMGGGSDEEIEEGGAVGVGTNRWPRDETLALLKTRADMEGIFRESLGKGRLWEEISRKLAELGYNRSAKKCKEKFENVHKYYKRTKDGKAGRQDGKNYRFFSQLESLYTKKNNSTNDYTSPRVNVNNNIPMIGSNVHNTPQKPSQEESEEAEDAEEEEEEEEEVEAAAEDVGGNAFCNKSGVSLFSLPRSSPTLVERFVPNNAKVVEPTYNIPSNFSSNSSSSSSSEEDYHDPIDTKRKKKRKRRSKSSDNMIQFFEHLMKKVIDKQEELQQKFLEALERRDKERIIREEAWKSQEMARLGKELEVRSQESAMAASRDTALVAFLQQAAGQNFQLPPLALTRNTVANPIFTTNAASEDQLQSFSSDPINKRWPKPEVVALIKLRSGFDSRFREPGPKGQIWKQISAEMSALGFNRSPNRCKEKWENINKYFKKTRENNKKRSENSKTCPYFTQLDLLYKRGLLGSSSKHNLIAHKSEVNQSENPEDPGGNKKRGGENGEEEEEANREALPQVLAIMPSQGETDAKEGDHSADNIIRQ